MLLCDIGNTSYHFLDARGSYKESVATFNPQSIKERVYYICVNAKLNAKLKNLDNWIDLKDFVDMSRYYETMGVDRVFALEAQEHGIIVDAGSAITVDLISEGEYLGGFIYPGVNAMSKTYANISTALAYDFNFDIEMHRVPKNSQDAISYGFLKTLYSEVVSHNLPIILTGGDAQKLKKIFLDASIDEHLIFHGMKKIINQKILKS